MSGIPVVISSHGGIPVRQVTSGAPVMTVATNGFGIPIVLSTRGLPFVVEGLTPEPGNAVLPNPAPPDPALTWSSDFEAIADGTFLKDLPGWNWRIGDGIADVDETGVRIVDGRLVSTAGYSDARSNRQYYRDIGVIEQTAIADGCLTPGGNGAISFILGVDPATDTQVCVYLDFGSVYVEAYNAAGTKVVDVNFNVAGYNAGTFDFIAQLSSSNDDGVVDEVVMSFPGQPSLLRTAALPTGLGLGTYAGVTNGFGAAGSSADALTFTGATAYPPISLSLAGIDAGTKKAYTTLTYWTDEASEYEMKLVAGATVISDWAVATVSDNDVAGTARLDSAAAVPALYEGVDVTILVRKLGTTDEKSITVYYPGTLTIGQNANAFGGIQLSGAAVRAYTNMAVQGAWQDTTIFEWPYQMPGQSAKLDADGMPLTNGLHFVTTGPDPDGTLKTVEITWTGGPVTFYNIQADHPDAQASLLAENAANVSGGILTITGTNSIQITYEPTIDLISGAAFVNQLGYYLNIDEGNPPKNFHVHLLGENLTPRFTPAYITLMNQLRGPIRFMDSLRVNGAFDQEDYGVTWANRTRRSMIGMSPHPLGVAIEDMVELCYLTERAMHWTIPVPCAYSAEGQTYATNCAALIWDGTGSDIAYSMSDKNLVTIAEVGNELWNYSGGFQGFYMLDEKGKLEGRIPAEAPNWWGQTAEKNYVHNLLMPLIEAEIPSAYLRRCMGMWYGGGPVGYYADGMKNPGGGNYDPPPECDWTTAHIDCASYACYLPNDPNSPGPAPSQPDSHSPEDISDWLLDLWEQDEVPLITAWNEALRADGIAPNQYEFGFALGTITGLTNTEERALRVSPAYKTAVRTVYNRLTDISDGAVCIYSDYGPTWGHMLSLHSPYNVAWEAVTEWQEDQ